MGIEISYSTSVFDDLNTEYYSMASGSSGQYRQSVKKHVSAHFHDLVIKRIEYLESLKTLQYDWVSGNSASPSPAVLDEAKSILNDFEVWISSNNALPKPGLVMGPIPIGGFSIEFKVRTRMTIYLHLFNSGESTIEIEDIPNGNFSELETKGNSLEYLLKKAYQYFASELIHA